MAEPDIQLEKHEVYACACGNNAVVLRPEAPRSKVFEPLCKKCAELDSSAKKR